MHFTQLTFTSSGLGDKILISHYWCALLLARFTCIWNFALIIVFPSSFSGQTQVSRKVESTFDYGVFPVTVFCFSMFFFFFLMDCSKLNLKSNYKSSDMLTGMSTTESTTTSPAHFLFHWMIRTFNTVGSNIIYKSCTGCFILFSVRMSSLITGYSF